MHALGIIQSCSPVHVYSVKGIDETCFRMLIKVQKNISNVFGLLLLKTNMLSYLTAFDVRTHQYFTRPIDKSLVSDFFF